MVYKTITFHLQRFEFLITLQDAASARDIEKILYASTGTCYPR